jgi:HPt (histidine-containing phosphotransfer) domain-containing protein
MDDYICKPFGRDDLAAALDNWVPARAAKPAPRELAAVQRSGAAGPVDFEVFDRLTRFKGGSDEFRLRLIATFESSSEKLVQQIEDSASRGDLEGLAATAHTLKSSSAQLGALRLAAIAQRLERAALAGQLEECEQLAEQALAERADAVAELAGSRGTGAADG